MDINLHIEQLILKELDLPRSQRSQVHAALTTELNRLISQNGLPEAVQSGGAIPQLPLNVSLAPGLPPTQLGQHIAKAVYGSLSSETLMPANPATPVMTQPRSENNPSQPGSVF